MARFVLLLVMASVTLTPLMALASKSQDPLHIEREIAAHKWSPLVWLHPDEEYFPSSVPFFLRHITPSMGQDQATVQQGSTAPELNLPLGRPSREFYLVAPHNFGCLDCTLPEFLHGQKPQKKYSPPVYVTIHTCLSFSSPRGVRSTQNSFIDDELINVDNYNDIAEDMTTSFMHTDQRYTFPIINPTMQQNISFSYSNETNLQQNFSSQFNQTQRWEKLFPVSTLETSSPLHIFNEENATTTLSSICINNGTLCPTSNSEEMIHENVKKIKISNVSSNLITRNVALIDNFQSTTGLPYTNESQTIKEYLNEFQNSSRSQQHDTQVNDINDLENTKLTSKGQYNNKERHASPFTYRDQFYSSEQQYTVTYWMFYPYNKGKKICTINLGFFGQMFKPKVNGMCHGEEITVGNHVGDWEHISIQFSGSKPNRMYVSAHTFGAYYTYDAQNHRFVYEDEDTRKGISLSPVYPKTIQLTESHPILYSARGSHGLWGTEGINQYNSLPMLQDETRKGTPWKIWKNLKLIDEQDPISEQPHRHWWKYEGRWGNPSSKCHVLLAGFCEHVKGPRGIPTKRINFPCQNI